MPEVYIYETKWTLGVSYKDRNDTETIAVEVSNKQLDKIANGSMEQVQEAVADILEIKE